MLSLRNTFCINMCIIVPLRYHCVLHNAIMAYYAEEKKRKMFGGKIPISLVLI